MDSRFPYKILIAAKRFRFPAFPLSAFILPVEIAVAVGTAALLL